MKVHRLAVMVCALSVSWTSLLPAAGPYDLHAIVAALDPASDDHFGRECAMSGDFAVVGAPDADDGPETDTGSAYVFQFDGLRWVQVQKLTASTPMSGALFGSAVDIAGDVIVVGAPGADTTTSSNAGTVYVFFYDGSTWSEQSPILESPSPIDGDLYGASIALSDAVLAVGEPSDDTSGVGSGETHIYRLNPGTSSFDHEATLSTVVGVSTTLDADDRFGGSVAVSGDSLVVGADLDEGGGSAYFFRYDAGSITWSLVRRETSTGTPSRFGTSVAVDGDLAAVGATGDAGGPVPGSVFLFRDNSSTWTLEDTLAGTGMSTDDAFGDSLTIEADRVVVGAPGFEGLTTPRPGGTFLFEFDGSWSESGTFAVAPGISAGDGFGGAVAIGERGVLIGAAFSDLAASGAGVVVDYGVRQNRLTVDTVVLTSDEADTLGDVVTVSIRLQHNVPGGIGGFSFGLRSDPEPGSSIQPDTLSYTPPPGAAVSILGDPLGDCATSGPDDFVFIEINAPNNYVRMGVVFATNCLATLSAGEYEIATLTYDVSFQPVGVFNPVVFDTVGSPPPTPVEFATEFGALVPEATSGGILQVSSPGIPDLGSSVWIPNRNDFNIVRIQLPSDDCGFDPLGTGVSVVVPCPGLGCLPDDIAAVAVGFGAIWFAGRDENLVYRFLPSDTANTAILQVGTDPVAIAVDTSGDVWCSNSGDSTLSKISADGTTSLLNDDPPGRLGPAVPLPGMPGGIAGDPIGNMWVVTREEGGNGLNTLTKVDPNGRIVLSISNFSGSDSFVPLGVAVDPDGFVWVTLRSASGLEADLVQRRASDGGRAGDYPLSIGFFATSPASGIIALRRHAEHPEDLDLNEAFVVGGSGIAHFRPFSTSEIQVDLGIGTISSIVIDGCDRMLVFTDSGVMHDVDPETLIVGSSFDQLPPGFDPTFLGDAAGYQLAGTLAGQADFDGDGSANGLELRAGSHPYLELITPDSVDLGFVFPVADLECTTVDTNVLLTWTIAAGQLYDIIEVRRSSDGETFVLIDTLVSTDTSYSDDTLTEFGDFTYLVVGILGATPSLSEQCTSTVGPGQVLESVLGSTTTETAFGLYDIAAVAESDPVPSIPEVAYFALDSATSRVYAFDENLEPLYNTTLPTSGGRRAHGLAYNPANGGSLIYAQGGPGMSVLLSQSGLTGTPLGTDGVFSDCLKLCGQPGGLDYQAEDDVVTLVMPTGALEPGAGCSLSSVPVGCEIFAVRLSDGQVVYKFEHPVHDPGLNPGLEPWWGLSGVAHSASTGETGLGLNGGDIKLARIVDGDRIELATYTVTTTGGPVADISITPDIVPITLHGFPRFTGLAPGGPGLASASTNGFGDNAMGGFAFRGDRATVVGLSSSFAHQISLDEPTFPPPAPSFVRSDANADGGTDIGDAIFLLSLLFSMGKAMECESSGDANDDGMIDIGDPISILSFLFSGGPDPAPPYPDCGTDPTADSLSCDSFTPCP